MADSQAIADPVEIETLRGAATMRRTRDGGRFTERSYDVGYLDTTPLPGTGAH